MIPSEAPHRHVELLVATGTTVFTVDASSYMNHNLTSGPVKRMSLSPNNKLVAIFLADGRMQVVSAQDLTKILCDFATKSTVPPLQMSWCGSDSVLMYWDKLLLMVGPQGDWIKYSYEDAIALLPEIDGARIISGDKCELLQRVPDTTESIFQIGSTAPAAALYDAFDHFERKSAKADENIRLIRPDLADAVDACIEAAGHDFTPYYQQKLLKAASFGKSFLDAYRHDNFYEMCQVMRVLNAIRHYEIGIPLTLAQYVSFYVVESLFLWADLACF